MSFKGAASTFVTALPKSSFMALKRIIEVIISYGLLRNELGVLVSHHFFFTTSALLTWFGAVHAFESFS
jgi:hypothetical protein